MLPPHTNVSVGPGICRINGGGNNGKLFASGLAFLLVALVDRGWLAFRQTGLGALGVVWLVLAIAVRARSTRKRRPTPESRRKDDGTNNSAKTLVAAVTHDRETYLSVGWMPVASQAGRRPLKEGHDSRNQHEAVSEDPEGNRIEVVE